MTAGPTFIQSRDNAFVKDLRRLAQDSGAYRRQGRVLARGATTSAVPHWSAACSRPSASMPNPPGRSGEREWGAAAARNVVLADALWADVSGLESPARMGFVVPVPEAPVLQAGLPTVVLDRLQDAGNVGSILRSASAFGFRQVAALKGTAGLWSPKVLRAGMGAHFALHLVEGLAVDDIDALALPLLATSSHGGDLLHRARLPWPCGWILGHEGQGVSEALQQRATHLIRIAQPGGEESLNVGAAAAICLHASAAHADSSE